MWAYPYRGSYVRTNTRINRVCSAKMGVFASMENTLLSGDPVQLSVSEKVIQKNNNLGWHCPSLIKTASPILAACPYMCHPLGSLLNIRLAHFYCRITLKVGWRCNLRLLFSCNIRLQLETGDSSHFQRIALSKRNANLTTFIHASRIP